jgi:conjugal transfer mating pair stabilization protein TraN
MSKCKPEEAQLSKFKREKKCVSLGSYCFDEKLKICLDKRESYCCFDTVLAKTLIVEGQKKLGKSLGSGKNPDCSGFSVEEIKKVDFKKADFTEFFEVSVVPNLKVPKQGLHAQGREEWFFKDKGKHRRARDFKRGKNKGPYTKSCASKGRRSYA